MADLIWTQVGDEEDVLVTTAHEPHLYVHLDDGKDHDGVFLDVGCHRGKYTLPMARRYQRVFALDPDPSQIKVLHENLEANHIDNVVVCSLAAWDSNTELALAPRRGTAQVVEGTGVPAFTLDAMFFHRPIELIKIDTEGAEARVLRGAQKILARRHPKLVIELHDRLFGEHLLDEVVEVLSRHHYEWIDINQNVDIHHLVAV